jgi:FkbH-like protein
MPQADLTTPDLKNISKELRERTPLNDRRPLKIGLAGSFTIDALVPYLGGQLLQEADTVTEISVAPYNQIHQLCINPGSVAGFDAVDVIIIMWRLEDMWPLLLDDAIEGDAASVDRIFVELDRLFDVVERLKKNFSGTLIVSTPPYPVLPNFAPGELHQPTAGGLLYSRILIHTLNRLAATPAIKLLDLHGLLMLNGYASQHDMRKWYLYKQPYTEAFWSKIGAQLARIIRAQKTSSKKCVVLDCDNTIWGGIIGEDGMSGIELGSAFPGAAFQDFQKYLLALRRKGILLAVASKNNEEDVFEVFDKHDAMLLSREHISVFQIHWQSKVDSLKRIAEALNIGLDSLVFVDDNPKEVAEVNERLPEVTTVLVPEEPAYLPALLANSKLFDSPELTTEDRSRAEMMRTEQERQRVREELSEQAFLEALQLKISVFEVEEQHLSRVTQLVNKTNQFNLMTNRYSSEDVKSLVRDRDVLLLAMEVSDQYGDYGLVGVASLRKSDDREWLINDFLMSCRVLGRGAETAFLACIADAVKMRGGAMLRGQFRATKKNALVAAFYQDHSFVSAESAGQWLAAVDAIRRPGKHVSLSLRLA